MSPVLSNPSTTRDVPPPGHLMPPSLAHPLRFEPILKRLIWGGRRLETLLNKPLGLGDDYAESWEIADHRADVSRVAGGPHGGRSLRELLAADAVGLMGRHMRQITAFPLLVKLLDAHRTLSVQVHPDDSLAAAECDDAGKTEAWVILHAEPGSEIYAGLKEGVDREEFEGAARAGVVEPLLNRFPARPGDCIFIPAGTVHAIGAGVVLFEVQQSSDATFRIDDWGRLDANGKPRQLHLEQAMRAIDFGRGPVAPERPVVESQAWGFRERLLAGCPQFALERCRVEHATKIGRDERFTIVAGLDGVGVLEGLDGSELIRPGDVLLLPAALGTCRFGPLDGAATILICHLPD